MQIPNLFTVCIIAKLWFSNCDQNKPGQQNLDVKGLPKLLCFLRTDVRFLYVFSLFLITLPREEKTAGIFIVL